MKDAARLTPIVEDDVRATGSDHVVLVRPKFGPVGRRLARVLRLQDELTVRLDGLGSEVWHLIDGTRTGGQILEELEARHPGETDLGPRLGRYLSMLAGARLIRL